MNVNRVAGAVCCTCRANMKLERGRMCVCTQVSVCSFCVAVLFAGGCGRWGGYFSPIFLSSAGRCHGDVTARLFWSRLKSNK